MYSYLAPEEVYGKKYSVKKLIIKLGLEPTYRIYTSNKYYINNFYVPASVPVGSIQICPRSYTEPRNRRYTYRWRSTFINGVHRRYNISKHPKIVKNTRYVLPKYIEGKYVGRMRQKWVRW